ncbi:hypothetical protein Nstercoris_02273 (plasmid) [Nitrosomonas stercoris]|uniref:Uncharacterized protein n=1 Tax=Nitrosomonas stercoris TaxID=1444684 RepID=A0A4Y1YPR1_9PROT|nr:hypothetical protein Nstercoris_02273 [Nitrosomonas stercoris]
MYTIAQIEAITAAIHNQDSNTSQAIARMEAISNIYLKALADGVTVVERESLTEQEIEMINYFLVK